ncbi:circularly permuted type 2 ATP-grasp protein [Pseudorhodoferax sp. Leaf267]|uniref:circularly permuted type 2 ATP-grasp protein n=1 Tax=Pseudorhodoferax sp. Leaf267 TaxID=1736316 RepID=UPI0007006242|nr:circularly permuted type 2 ATP-grasp protein [Pseudorhodoferax sp. Leaf267]KQP22620.1 A circularly permuted ATPgrasp family protein [Pseudorhodoferax sp. Leaf267]
MDKYNNNLFDAQTQESPAGLASSLARLAMPGHFDELRGRARTAHEHAARAAAAQPDLTKDWAAFFDLLGRDGFSDLNRRTAQLQRQLRDNGVTYNVYADAANPQRPWSLDLFPLIVTPASWRQIEAGVLQRVRVLDSVMADVYGPQRLLAKGLLPPALVQGHPGYLRSMHGCKPRADTHLHITAYDLAHGADGNWWVVSQRTQAPSGLGYLLENRLAISRLFPQAFESLNVQRLAATYSALIDGIKKMSPAGADAHIALLTPGPYNETYFEHAYLARYLGITLVEGSDLTVRDQRLYLKTLKGLEPVHGLLKRLDDQYLDPLELRPDSRLGVPGLLQVIRAGNVLIANAPGSAFLESPALLGFLPALARHLLDEELLLPALPTWWCGERAAMEAVLPDLSGCVIKPTYGDHPGAASFEAKLGGTLSRRELDEWAGRIVRQGDEHTVQTYMPLSQMPTWTASPNHPARIAPRSVMLRVFAVSDGPRSWRVLPGGLARMVSEHHSIASMQRGGSSADVWVRTEGEVDRTTLLPTNLSPTAVVHRKRMVTSRAAENLFWLGRYAERTENTLRLARVTLNVLNGEDQSSASLLSWLHDMAVSFALVLPAVPSPLQARRVFERSLIAGLGSTDRVQSVGYNLRSTRHAASAVRERLSQEHWNVIVRAEEDFLARCADSARDGDFSAVEALRLLESTSTATAAMTGAQTDRMTRDDGWRLLSIGRHVERLGFLSSALARGVEAGATATNGGFEAMLSLFDSSITFHSQYQQSREMAALLDLLVLDRDNPRSLGWVAHTLRGRVAKLAGTAPAELTPLAQDVVAPDSWSLEEICAPDADDKYPVLLERLEQCTQCAYDVSDAIGSIYFTHSRDVKKSVGA